MAIGGIKDKWRCKVCKFANEAEADSCSRCRETKTVMKEESKVAVGRVRGSVPP